MRLDLHLFALIHFSAIGLSVTRVFKTLDENEVFSN